MEGEHGRPSAVSRQPSAVSRQPSAVSRQPSAVSHQISDFRFGIWDFCLLTADCCPPNQVLRHGSFIIHPSAFILD
jgi:hypothetical protein